MLKYIMFDDQFPVIFGDYFIHAEVAQRTRRLACETFAGPGKGEVTGAGFVAGDGSEWVAYGRSESLDKGPGEKDSIILSRVLNNR